MNAEELVQIITKSVMKQYPDELISHIKDTPAKTTSTHWTTAPAAFLRRASPEDLEAIKALICWVAMDSVGLALGVLDPASGNEDCGDVTVKDDETGESLIYLQQLFFAECEKLGLT